MSSIETKPDFQLVEKKKLSVEDLIAVQERNERLLSEIQKLLYMSKPRHSWGAVFLILSGIVLLFVAAMVSENDHQPDQISILRGTIRGSAVFIAASILFSAGMLGLYRRSDWR